MSLREALSKVQKDVDKVVKNAVNSHTNAGYPTLESVLDVLNESLNSHGIVLNQMPKKSDGEWVLQTKVSCEAETETFEVPLLGITGAKNEMQALGSAITYARRFALMSYFKLSATSDEDTKKRVLAAGARVQQVREAAKLMPPATAEPRKEIKNHAPQASVFRFRFGKYTGKSIEEVGIKDAKNYLDWIVKQRTLKGENESTANEKELAQAIEQYTK